MNDKFLATEIMDKNDGLNTFRDICRLCGGELVFQFNLIVLKKYDISYHSCLRCKSLQSETPYWLDEAYKNITVNLDTGAAQRNINNFVVAFVISKIFRLNNTIEIGGGDGLLCRLLRDHKINSFVTDKYIEPVYVKDFMEPNFSSPDLVMAFEVIEHLPNPNIELDSIFNKYPNIIILSTEIYKDNGRCWWYLVPEGGQHVFFYSASALKYIGNKYNYNSVSSGGYIYFINNRIYSKLKFFIIKIILNKYVRRLIKSFIMLLPTPGVIADFNALKSK